MEFKEIIQLIQTVSDSNVNNFKMKDGDFKINISKDVHVSDVRKGTVQYGINEGGLPAPQIAVNVPVPRQKAACRWKYSEVPVGWNLLCIAVTGGCSLCSCWGYREKGTGAWYCGGNEANE